MASTYEARDRPLSKVMMWDDLFVVFAAIIALEVKFYTCLKESELH